MVWTCDFCGVRSDASDDPASDDSDSDSDTEAGTRPVVSGVDEEAVLALTWTTAVERGRTRHFCPTCSRAHLRAMEGKLDSEWW